MSSMVVNPRLDQVHSNSFVSGSCNSSASSSRSTSPAISLNGDLDSFGIGNHQPTQSNILPKPPALANTHTIRPRCRQSSFRSSSLSSSPPIHAMATLADLHLTQHGIHVSQAEVRQNASQLDRPQISPKVTAAVSRLPASHPTTRATRLARRYSSGEVVLHDVDRVMPAPRPRVTRIKWRDSTPGRKLCSSMYFRQNEPASQCRKSDGIPTPRRATWAGAAPRAPQKVLEFDSSTLPTSNSGMLVALSAHGVQVESVSLRCPLIFVTVRVLNVAFEKKVFIRWTTDDWRTTEQDEVMSFLPGCADPSSDRFYATLRVSSYDMSQLAFCVGYQSAGQEFWDNNNGSNYVVKMTQPQLTFGTKQSARTTTY
eukprot:TRINITY_DN11691_c0_g1_i12.p1 TRINITY_DN11691_c0_g1~~TRINITY_DN11691_c0_g1_i12.p1  ORF type:complete len:370 (+),score=61.86 TRINITY_DN11691_c0_g1_i12:1350-2459(+)